MGTDRIDLVDLSRANGLLRFRAARDGKPLFQKNEGEFAKFWEQAVNFWCDAGPILRAEYEAIFEGLGFRNRIVHAYEKLDMHKIYKIAQTGPTDLRAFFAALHKSL